MSKMPKDNSDLAVKIVDFPRGHMVFWPTGPKAGSVFWYKDVDQGFVMHRDDGPAAVWGHGLQWWRKEGKMHRTDGPAVINPDGSVEFWLDDIQYTEEEFLRKTKTK